MESFYTRYPALAEKDTRCLVVIDDHPVPADRYGFVDLFCADSGCDCRRVMLQVRSTSDPAKVWATITYGWESPLFYREWSGDMSDYDYATPALEIGGKQSEHADYFLSAFREFIKDPSYVNRLKRHYQMFRKTVK